MARTVRTALVLAIGVAVLSGCRGSRVLEFLSAQRDAVDDTVLAGIDAGVDAKDPMSRCLQTPVPERFDWSPELIAHVCREELAASIQAEDIRRLVDGRDWDGLEARFQETLDRHVSGDSPQRAMHQSFPRKGWSSLAEFDTYSRRWLRARPGSGFAMTLRARYLVDKARDIRGEDSAAETGERRMREAAVLGKQAAQMAHAALKVTPRLTAAHRIGIQGAALAGLPEWGRVLLDHAISVEPSTIDVRYVALNYLGPMWGGDFATMEAIVDGARETMPDGPALARLEARRIGLIAEMLSMNNRRRVNLLEDALDWAPDINALQAAADTAHFNGRYLAAVDYGTQAMRYEADPDERLMERARDFYFAQDYSRAAKDYHRLHVRTPENLDRLAWAANAEAQAGDLAAAREHFDAVLAKNPKSAAGLGGYARMLHGKMNQTADARPFAEGWTAAAPDDPESWLLLLDIYAVLGDARARPVAQRFIALAERRPEAYPEMLPKAKHFLATGEH